MSASVLAYAADTRSIRDTHQADGAHQSRVDPWVATHRLGQHRATRWARAIVSLYPVVEALQTKVVLAGCLRGGTAKLSLPAAKGGLRRDAAKVTYRDRLVARVQANSALQRLVQDGLCGGCRRRRRSTCGNGPS